MEVEDHHPRAPTPRATMGPSYLSYLALPRAAAAPSANGDTVSVTGTITETGGRGSARGADTPVRQASATGREGSRSSSPHPSILTARQAAPPKLPSPRLFFAHFVDHTAHFIRFLEEVASRRWGQSLEGSSASAPILEASTDEKNEQAAVWNTLLELYLSTLSAHTDTDPSEASHQERKIIRLLRDSNLPFDLTHALIVCSTHTFTPGLVLLWEKFGMYEDVLRFWMDRDREGTDPEASSQVLHYLNLYGPTHPHLYPLVLRFLTSNASLLSRHTSDLKAILEHIDQERIMPPLGVVQVLSRNGITTVGLVKQWLMSGIQASQEELQAVGQINYFILFY